MHSFQEVLFTLTVHLPYFDQVLSDWIIYQLLIQITTMQRWYISMKIPVKVGKRFAFWSVAEADAGLSTRSLVYNKFPCKYNGSDDLYQ